MILYLLDANVLIQSKNKFYKFNQIPHFWTFVAQHAELGQIKIPREVFDEIEPGNREDPLYIWARANKSLLLLGEEVDIDLLQEVMDLGYSNDLTDSEVRALRIDPFLIAYAKALPNRTVVTLEGVQSESKPKNRKIPLACRLVNVRCISLFDMLDELNFRIPLI